MLTLASGEITYVDDVFSTFLYDGTGSAQTITNGIDLDGKGGMVWLKSRGNNYGWRMADYRGATKAIESYDTTINTTESNGLTAFTSTGLLLVRRAITMEMDFTWFPMLFVNVVDFLMLLLIPHG